MEESETMMETISIIVPAYNEQEAIPIFYQEMNRVWEESMVQRDLALELWFIDDGSKDDTMKVVKELAAKDERVHYVSFSRNFGKEAAMYAGLSAATGEYVAIMDADLQDPPALLPQMYEAIITEDYDSVATRRVTRKGEPIIRSFFARCFYRLMNQLSTVDLVDGARDYRLMKRVMVDAILSMPEYNRFTKGIFGWVGFRTKWMEFENVERAAGETKWSFWKLFLYSLEGIIGFSVKPLMIASWLGIFMTLVSGVAIIFTIVRQLVYGGSAFGWPSLVCIIVLIGGIQLFCMGILGQYLAKTYLETKNRPIYIAREKH